MLEPLLGPLVAVECRRSLGRGWVLVLRALAAVPPAVVMLAVLWFWWFELQVMPDYSPRGALLWGMVAVEAMLVTVALLLGPALLAGTLAGENVRSTLGLLLAAQVSASEIVMGRLAGRLCVVGAVVAAGLPPLVWFTTLCGLGPLALAVLLALPAAVAFGGGGLALALSVVARRGRDALLVVYLLELLLLLAPALGSALPAALGQPIDRLNPYRTIAPIGAQQDIDPALTTAAWWTALGAAGCGWAAWRLRPSYLHAADENRRRKRLFWRARLPVLGDRPMIWKELYIEQVHALSRVVKWAGIVVVAVYSGTTFVLAGLIAWDSWMQPEGGAPGWALSELTDWLGWSWLMAWLIQWAAGLRAAAAIASERQQGTWDGLLVSPLEGRDIVLAKIYGTIFALRGFVAVVVLAWIIGLLCGALEAGTMVELLGQTLLIGGFMVAIGIGFSLHCESATRAMTFTIACWLAAAFATTILAGILTLMGLLAWFVWVVAHEGFAPGVVPGAWPEVVFTSIRLALYALAALLAAVYIQRRFDVLAGRSSASASWPGAGTHRLRRIVSARR